MSVSGYFLTTVLGPVTAYLAMCAATTGDLDESVALFEESDRVMAEFGCHGLLPFLRLTYAEVLLRRAAGNHRPRAMQLLEQVRQGATAIQAPTSSPRPMRSPPATPPRPTRRTQIIWCPEADLR
jgi:hypothetical protein